MLVTVTGLGETTQLPYLLPQKKTLWVTCFTIKSPFDQENWERKVMNGSWCPKEQCNKLETLPQNTFSTWLLNKSLVLLFNYRQVIYIEPNLCQLGSSPLLAFGSILSTKISKVVAQLTKDKTKVIRSQFCWSLIPIETQASQ